MLVTRIDKLKFVGQLNPLDCRGVLTYIGPACRERAWKMIGQNHSYRYYYYYGPLSTRRDGRAMSCRETIE